MVFEILNKIAQILNKKKWAKTEENVNNIIGHKKENILNDSKTNNFILNNETKQDEIYKLTYNNKKIDKNDYIEIQIKAWEE